ncbi:hypothetical protein X797_009710 [Metarhizium robertsii]|uniref:Uncharacterized protein n=2 Tax=Metarhizium robertsii TaxID=568076 RepID=A0A0A1UQG4_9HYPO|nr:hypothetical protein X797_009710 [Metarhizium robertsii]
MHWIIIVTLLPANFLHMAGAGSRSSILYVDDEPAMTFHYTTDQPAYGNWIGVWKADDATWQEDEAAMKRDSSVAWHYARGIDGEVRLPIKTTGKYKACLFASSSSTPRTLAGPEEFELASNSPCNVATNPCEDGEKECFGNCISTADLCNGDAFGVCPWTRPSIWQGGVCCNGGTDGTEGGDNCTPQIPPCNPKSGKECYGKCISKDDFCHPDAFGVCPAAKPSIWQGGVCCNGGTDGTQGGDNCSPQIPPCNPNSGKECSGKCISKDAEC